MMKATNIEERLALIGAVLVLIGVSSAADDALAGETAITTTPVAVHDTRDNTKEIAAEANKEAAAKAAQSLAKKNWLDLDIRLEDHITTLVAGRE